jgi:Rieske Fe-S protein
MSDRTPALTTDEPADTPSVEHDQQGTSRRAVLRAAGLVALTGGGAALAACSADAEVAAPSASSAAPSASASSASSPSASASASASPSASASSSAPAPSGPSVATSKVPVGGGVILDDADYVITQPTKGEFKAFSKICTHQGCPVTEVAGDSIVCKCHGSKFSIEDGSVTSPPANKPLKESSTTVSGDKVYVEA